MYLKRGGGGGGTCRVRYTMGYDWQGQVGNWWVRATHSKNDPKNSQSRGMPWYECGDKVIGMPPLEGLADRERERQPPHTHGECAAAMSCGGAVAGPSSALM